MAMSAVSGDTSGLPARGSSSGVHLARLSVAWSTVGVSAVCWVAVMLVAFPADPLDLLPWVLVYAASIAVTAVIVTRVPWHPLVPWLGMGTLTNVNEIVLWVLRGQIATDAAPPAIAAWNLAGQWLYLLPAIGVARVLGLFPDGEVHRRYERVALRLTWLVLLVPVIVTLWSPTVVLPFYVVAGSPVPNPLAIGFPPLDPRLAGALQEASGPAVVVLGAVVLAFRYRSADRRMRQRMRWLLAPVALLPIPLVAQALLVGDAEVFVSLCWAAVIVSFMVAVAVSILQPADANLDRVVRRWLVYWLLWMSIAAVYVIVAATVGAAAGTLLPVGWAVAIGLVAAVAFQPVRARLERLADRWVFGAKTDPAQLVVGLGESLSGTYDLDALLPRMRATLEDGIGLRWATVRLLPGDGSFEQSASDRIPELTVPIEVDGERVGLIECGPKRSGRISTADAGIIETFARQAGMAVRNVRLKQELADQAVLLRASRARIVHAQEQERRRIERNIHDGVQQDLTALIGLAGHARAEFDHDPRAVGDDIEAMQEGLSRVLADLRDFAQGIHPAVLSDRGLLAAVEALGGRHPVPVTVRADASLRSLRLPDEVEAVAYFTIAEALANTLKHGRAHRIDVELRTDRAGLTVSVSDDGVGFDSARVPGTGLANLRDRVAAIGGAVHVDSSPGAGTSVVCRLPLHSGEAPP